jgi:hypothetical protein
MLRKQVRKESFKKGSSQGREIDIAATAVVQVTSEMADYPLDHVFDSSRGPGGSRWVAGEPGEQTIIVDFDTPQALAEIALEIEEQKISRTQELSLSISSDSGKTYRELLRQEYNFSPPATTFEQENWRIVEDGITHLRLWIKPDKGGNPCRATITSLVLIGAHS